MKLSPALSSTKGGEVHCMSQRLNSGRGEALPRSPPGNLGAPLSYRQTKMGNKTGKKEARREL
jgi:hypothetical protein